MEILSQTLFFAKLTGFRIESFIGGMDLAEDRRKIQGCRALVGTPGRILHLITNGVLKTSDLRLFVLDEADQLMGDSFRNDIRSIRKRLPKAIQTLAVSATFDNNLDLELAKMMNHPVGVTPCREVPILLGVKQLALVLPFDPAAPAPNSMNDMFAKVKAMHTVFSMVAFNQTLVFSNSQSRAESYCNYLRQNGKSIFNSTLFTNWIAMLLKKKAGPPKSSLAISRNRFASPSSNGSRPTRWRP